MGYSKLIQSLYQECEDKIRLLWKDSEPEAEKIRAEQSSRLEQMRAEYSITQGKEVKSQEEKILSKAGIEARKIKLLAERALADRLYPLAVSFLHELKNEQYNIEFESLVKELPAVKWEEVRINPEDRKVAKAHFADSRITPDNKITGGFEVLRQDGRICINNTFEKRLERAWEDLVPLLIRDAYKEAAMYGNSS